VAGLDADARVVEGFERREGLGEEASLDLFCYFELLRAATLGLEAFGCLAALALDLAGDLVGAQ